MTQSCCPSCRLRFSPVVAAYLVACPQCGEPPQPIAGLAGMLGFRLFAAEEALAPIPQALAVSLPVEPPRARS
jgi:hypothetical protein